MRGDAIKMIFDWPINPSTENIIIWLVLYLIFLVIVTIFLKIALGFFSEARHTDFGQVFLTSFIITLVFFIIYEFFWHNLLGLIIILIIVWVIISIRHHTGFAMAILISIVAFILYIIVAFIISYIFGVSILIFTL